MTQLEWALNYARLGWPVFPCDPRSKEPLVPRDVDAAGKPVAGSGGLKKATTDPDTIKAWWTRWPKAMIALATGARAGFFVVDVDAGKDDKTGEEFTRARLLADLQAAVGELPATWMVGTPRGGCHIYFQYPHGQTDAHSGRALGNRTGMLARIDTRGEAGYVFAPPSQRADGRPYEWLVKPAGDADRPAPAPAALLDLILRRGRFDDRVVLDGSAPAPARARGARPAKAAAPAAAVEAEDHVRRYALAAMDLEIKVLRGSVAGTRNDNLFHAAIKMGQLVAAGALDKAIAVAALETVAREWPNFAKSRTTIESGFGKGLAEPRDLAEVRAQAEARARRTGSARDDGGVAPPPSDLPPPGGPEDYGLPPLPPAFPAGGGGYESEGFSATLPARADGPGEHDRIALNLRLAFFPQTDLGNGERFVERNRGRLLWCKELGWLWWDGRRWSREGADAKVRIAEHECVRAIHAEAEALRLSGRDQVVGWRAPKGPKKKKLTQDQRIELMAAALAGDGALPDDEAGADSPDEAEGESGPQPVFFSDTLDRWAHDSEWNARLAQISQHASAYLAVAPRELDADRFKINVLNGTLHVRRRGDRAHIDFSPHDQRDRLTKLAPVRYDRKARCPRYDDFLAQMQPKPDMRRFLHQWAGYSLTGDIGEQVLVFFWGKGRNGKSTLVDIWGHVLGEYGTSVPIETFLTQGHGKQGSQASPDLAMLRGIRFARTSEPDKGARLGEALIKLVTGGEPFPARELHMPFFQLLPQFKLTISGNYRPKIIGTDLGIWRRVKLVPWGVILDEKKVDRQLGDKLAQEKSGVLNRMLAGLADWLEAGLIFPDDVNAATETYRRDSDPLGRFLDACVVHAPGEQIQSSVLHGVFNAWCKANGEREWTATGFGLAMSDRGFESKKSNVSWWLNLRLVKAETDFVDNEGRPLREDAKGKTGVEDDLVPF